MAEETTKTTNAERCKRYREKYKEEYKISDALRKKHARLVLKMQNKAKHEEQKKKDRERKRLAKLRSKIQVNQAAASEQAASTSSPNPLFSSSSIKSRTVKRVEKFLPQSSRRKSEVIKSLASKFNVKVKFCKKTGRKKKVLSEEEQQWVKDFLDRPDISYTTPGRRDNVYIGIVNKVKRYALKRYILWKIRDIFDMINGSKIMENNPNSDTFESNFGKKLTFRQLYDIFKKNKQYIFNKKIPQWSCLCEICENAVFLVNGMNKKLFPECRLPETVNELVAKFSCSEEPACMNSQCDECSSTEMDITNFNVELLSDADTSNDDISETDDAERTKDSVTYYE